MCGTLRELLKVSTQKLRQPNQAVIPRQSYFNIVGDCITHVDVITLVFHCKRPIQLGYQICAPFQDDENFCNIIIH